MSIKKFRLPKIENMHQIVAEIDQLAVEFLWEQVRSKLPLYSDLIGEELMLYLGQRISTKIICTVFEDNQSREKEMKRFYKEIIRLSKVSKTLRNEKFSFTLTILFILFLGR